jgi:hypothetical protein
MNVFIFHQHTKKLSKILFYEFCTLLILVGFGVFVHWWREKLCHQNTKALNFTN